MIYIILEIESYIDRMRHIITQFHLFIFDSSMKWQLNLEEETTP